jgi:site-specific recombinase XerD
VPRLKATTTPESLPRRERSLVERYLSYRRSNSARSTVSRARSAVVRWACFLAARGVALEAARPADAVDYMATWDGQWSAGTKRQAISDLRAFCEWLEDAELAPRNPWRRIRGPRKPQRVPEVISDRELVALDRAVGRSSVRDLRDRALLHTLRATGGRIGEVRSLDLVRLHLDERYATVRGKGDRERLVYFDDPAAEALRLWLEAGRPCWARETRPVFVGRKGRRIGYTACRDAVIRAEQRARLARHVHPHLFRHTWATQLLENGANLREVQEMLGHESITSTQIYTHVAPTRLRLVYERAHRAPCWRPSLPQRGAGA